MKLLKLKKQFIAVLCGLSLLFGIAGVAVNAPAQSAMTTASADSSTEIVLGDGKNGGLNLEDGRFRLLFSAPINDLAEDKNIENNVPLSVLNGLQDKLLIAGKTPTEWSQLDVGFYLRVRSSSQPVFYFDNGKLEEKGYATLTDDFTVVLKEDCVLDDGRGTVKAFAIYKKVYGAWHTSLCSDLTQLGWTTRTQGPILYEGNQGGLFQIKVWFAQSVIAKNDGSDVNINVSDMEGLQYALYFNGKSLAQWAKEGALGTVTARSGGGFIFRFAADKYDTTKAHLVEVKDVVTTKGYIPASAYWIKAGHTSGEFNNADGTPKGNGYVYQGKTLELSRVNYDAIKVGGYHTLKIWFTDGANESPLVTTNNGEALVQTVSHLEGLEKVLKIDGKTIAEWETLLGGNFAVGSRGTDGRLTLQYTVSAMGENEFFGKNFTLELENDYMTSQGVVKAFKTVNNWALKQTAVNPTGAAVNYAEADSFHNMDEFFYFDVTFDKDILVSAPTVDTPLSNDALQKADLSNLVKVNGKDVPTAMYSVAVVKETTNTLRFSVLNAEKSHNFYFELLAGYVFPNGNVLEEDITLYYNEQNGTWRTTAMPDITVAYNANGGVGEMVGSTVAYASDYELQENAFTRQNYAFLGWARTADGEVVFKNGETLHLYVGGALENVNSTTLELFAVWEKTRGVQYVSISTAGDIGLNFYVDLDDATEATATVTMKGETATVVGVQAQDGLWKFTYGVAPKDYKETVTLTVEDITASYSVVKYADALPTTNKAYPLVSALIEYCEAARVYFAKETATATEALTADLTNFAGSVVGTQAGVSDVGATLTLEAKTTISVYFTAESLTGIVCKVDGKVVTPKAVAGANGRYVITIEDVVAKDLDVLYTISIGDCTITYGALSYVVSMHNSEDVALANVVKALYAFNVQANEYFAGV